MTTALRYKKLYQDRIPSEGSGRRQRFPAAAVRVFRELKAERAPAGQGARQKSGQKKAPARAKAGGGSPSLLTLSSISEKTGISSQTLNRYVKLFGDRIPHEGTGRKRRYHQDAIPVFRELRAQSKPGRKPKAAAPARPPARRKRRVRTAVKPGAAPPKLLTLTAIGQRTGISAPTLQRYLKLYGDQIPYEGEGRKRRYPPEAVAVFREIRSRSNRGRKAKTATGPKASPMKRRTRTVRRREAPAAAAAGSVEARLESLEAQVNLVLQRLEEPVTITLSRPRRK